MTISLRALLVPCLLAAAACTRASHTSPAPAAAPPVVAARAAEPAPAASTTVAPSDDELVEEAPEANPKSETITIKLVAEASRKARVFWGRKDLGLAPLELQRPRGSGPMDLLVIAPGALPLHTRVYTDRDDKLTLRLFSEGEAPSMLGYRADEAAIAKAAAAKAAQKAAAASAKLAAASAAKKRAPRGP
jgi:hypothetical protein